MAFPVFLDTCTIFGAALNDLLLTLAERNTYRPPWSADVLAPGRPGRDELAGRLDVFSRALIASRTSGACWYSSPLS